MREKLIWVSYFTEEDRDKEFSKPEDYPTYQLSEGYFGEEESHVFAKPRDFKGVASEILEHLKDPLNYNYSYRLTFIGDKAEEQIGETGRKVLEGILDLHNDLVTPSRPSVSFQTVGMLKNN